MTLPDEESPGRALATALAAMLGVALFVGLAVAGAVLGFVRLSGMGAGDAGVASDPPTMQVPEPSPTESPSGAGPSPSASPSPSRSAAPRPPIVLVASPEDVAAGERINLTGEFRGGDGAELQVQRREGAVWVDFPVTATVGGGRFDTWVQTSRTGRSPFRMVDEASGKRSNVVVVTVR